MNRDNQTPFAILPVHVPSRTRVEQFASDGECLVYSAVRDEANALNRTATEVWQLCDGVLTVRGIAEVLGRRYLVDPDLLFDDVREVLDVLLARGLIDIRPPANASR